MHRPFVALLALLVFGLSSHALATDAATIVAQGNGRGAEPCMACHGTDGSGSEANGYPRLAGQNAAYLKRQLQDFAEGTRSNPLMQPSAKALSVEERQALADYFSRLPLPAALAHPEGKMPAADSVGALLATRGDWSRGLPGCVQCHGPGGVGVGANFPPLAGQPASYIETQLKAWQSGSRHNDPLQLMQTFPAS